MVLIGLVASIALLFALDWRLALVTLVLLPSFVLGPMLLGKRAAQASYERQRDAASVMSAAQESIAGHAVIRAFGLEKYLARRFATDLDRFASSSIRSSFLGSLLGAGGGMSMSLTQVVSLGLGAFLVARGDMTVGALVAFQGLLANVVGPLRELAQIVEMFQQASGALQHLDEVLDERPQILERADAVPLPLLHEQLRFEGVGFRYEDHTQALTDVSFTVSAGHSVAIVGASGSGKSTVLHLLMRGYDPTSGRVTIDGHDLRSVTLESLRAQLGVVFQDSLLFNMSVRDNIRLGRLDASDADVEEAARAAEVHETILGMQAGYDTLVGEHGGRLSGGQRQRIALARALIRQPAVLILDEPTSALDPETERAVNATLDRLRPGRTTVTVTHRLAAVTNSDQILVLERGRVVERGTHAVLVAREGAYRRLLDQAQLSSNDVGDDVRRLQAVPYFRTLDTVLLTALAERITREERAAGQTFFKAGDAGNAFYLILRGQVDVVAPGPTGHEVHLARLREGDYFGEIALIDDVPRSATVRARTPTSVIAIDRQQFLSLVRSLPRLRSAFDAIISSRRANDRALLGPRQGTEAVTRTS
jgi:ATP-binding cassette subfamily B protein